MALVKCPECGEGVSTTAKNCPNCGYRSHKSGPTVFGSMIARLVEILGRQRKLSTKSLLIIVAGAVVIFIALVLFVLKWLGEQYEIVPLGFIVHCSFPFFFSLIPMRLVATKASRRPFN